MPVFSRKGPIFMGGRVDFRETRNQAQNPLTPIENPLRYPQVKCCGRPTYVTGWPDPRARLTLTFSTVCEVGLFLRRLLAISAAGFRCAVLAAIRAATVYHRTRFSRQVAPQETGIADLRIHHRRKLKDLSRSSRKFA